MEEVKTDIETTPSPVETPAFEPAKDPAESPVEPNTEAPAEKVETVKTDDTVVQSKEENSRFAASRRRAESEFQARMQRQKAEYDRQFAQLAKENGVADVHGVDDYLTKVKMASIKNRIDSGDLTPEKIQELIDQSVSNSPAVKAAQEALAEKKIEDDIKALNHIDPEIKTLDDVLAMDNADAIFDRVNSGMNLVDAYKIENFEKATSKKAEAAKQAAINQAKGLSHLEPVKGTVQPSSTEVDIPASALGKWQEAFPDDTPAQLKARYNKTR